MKTQQSLNLKKPDSNSVKIAVSDIKKLRQISGCGVMECRQALAQTHGDVKKALAVLKKQGTHKVLKRVDKQTNAGAVFAYVHANSQVASLVKLNCETDFVARNQDFCTLGKELAMQVAAMDPQSLDDLLAMDYIRDSNKKIKDLIIEIAAKTGENIVVNEFSRLKV